MNKVETTVKKMAHRQKVISKESFWKRTIRLLKQIVRGVFMFAFLFILPLFLTLYIIPNYKDNETYGFLIEISSIGGYLMLILLLQCFGTYRAMVSFFQRSKEAKDKKLAKAGLSETKMIIETTSLSKVCLPDVFFCSWECCVVDAFT